MARSIKGFPFKFCHLLRQFFVRLSNLAVSVMGEDALAGDATFCSTDGMWNLRIKDPDASSDGASQGFDDLSGVVGSSVNHREQYPVNLQVRIDASLYL